MEFDTLKLALKEVLAEERQAFWIDPEQHYQDHQQLKQCREAMTEMQKNHAFTSNIRTNTDLAKKAGIGVIISSVILFILGAVCFKVGGG